MTDKADLFSTAIQKDKPLIGMDNSQGNSGQSGPRTHIHYPSAIKKRTYSHTIQQMQVNRLGHLTDGREVVGLPPLLDQRQKSNQGLDLSGRHVHGQGPQARIQTIPHDLTDHAVFFFR